jgi:hypothetical protein
MAALPPEEFSRHKDALIASKLSRDRSKPGRTRSMPAPPDDRQRPLESPRPACCSSSHHPRDQEPAGAPRASTPRPPGAPRRRPPTAAPSARHPATHLLHYISSTCRQAPPPPAAAPCHHRRPPAPTSAALASASSRSDIPGGAGPARRLANNPGGQDGRQQAPACHQVLHQGDMAPPVELIPLGSTSGSTICRCSPISRCSAPTPGACAPALRLHALPPLPCHGASHRRRWPARRCATPLLYGLSRCPGVWVAKVRWWRQGPGQ